MKITVGIADDHQLLVKSLSLLISGFENCDVILEALNGEELLVKLATSSALPDILLIDVNMPIMDGAEAAENISRVYPEIKMVALSMKEDDLTVIRMIRAGCCAYLLKGMHPDQLEEALNEVHESGYHNADASNINFRKLMRMALSSKDVALTDQEKKFLPLACSDLTYKQIAARMNLAERTIDGYRESLFEKLKVQSRVGMVLEALRKGIVTLEELNAR